jgi:hypothetical protein
MVLSFSFAWRCVALQELVAMRMWDWMMRWLMAFALLAVACAWAFAGRYPRREIAWLIAPNKDGKPTRFEGPLIGDVLLVCGTVALFVIAGAWIVTTVQTFSIAFGLSDPNSLSRGGHAHPKFS